MARTKYFLKLKCDSSKLTAETLLPGVNEMEEIEILELIDSESEFHKDLLIIQEGDDSPEDIDNAILKFAEIETALDESGLITARILVVEMLGLVVSGCETYTDDLTAEGVSSAFSFLSMIRSLKHVELSSFSLNFINFKDFLDVAFLKGSTGCFHIPCNFMQQITLLFGINATGLPVSNNCYIVDFEDLTTWAEQNVNFIEE